MISKPTRGSMISGEVDADKFTRPLNTLSIWKDFTEYAELTIGYMNSGKRQNQYIDFPITVIHDN